jgi:hypothetical protein
LDISQQDALIERLKSILPPPVEVVEVLLDEQEEQERFVYQRLVAGEPGEVIVDVLDDGIEVLVFDVVWESAHSPTVRGESLRHFVWSDLPPMAEDVHLTPEGNLSGKGDHLVRYVDELMSMKVTPL